MIESHVYKPLTEAEWQAFMVNQVAYIKPVQENGQSVFGIYAADGRQLALIGDRDTAFAAVLSHDLQPVSVH